VAIMEQDSPVSFRHHKGAAEIGADDLERMRAVVAELAAALGQIDPAVLSPEVRPRFERAWLASKQLTRLVDSDLREPRGTGHGASGDGTVDVAATDLPDLTACRVLLAVHDVRQQDVVGRMLSELGARYELAASGDSAMRLFAAGSFDLAIVDAELTGVSGSDVVSAIRSRAPSRGRIPVLALCPEAASGLRRAMRDAGADFTLATPFHGFAAFAGALAGILEGTVEAETLPDRLVLDFERYDRLMEIAGDEGAAELLERLLEDLRQVERGLERALAEQNPAEIRTQTHVLIALAGAVGADELQRLTETLNGAAHRRTVAGMTSLGRQTLRQLGHLIAFVAEENEARN